MPNVALCELWSRWRAGALSHRRLQFRNGSVSSDLAGSDAFYAVAEDVRSNEVDPAEDEDDDARANDDTPKGQAKGFLAGGGFVEVAEHIHTEHDHGESESDKAVCWAKEWPVASEVGSKEGELRCEEEHFRDSLVLTSVGIL